MQEIKGNFKQYIFQSSNSYVVGLFKVKNTSEELTKYKNKTITFTGYFDELNENDLYIFHGKFVEHERYGNQFQVEAYEVVLPEEKDKIIDFLSSNLFPKIGNKKATKIVEVLGNDALKIILDNKDNLLLVPTITKENIDTIYENLHKYQNSYEIIVKLTKIGFTMKEAMQIYKEYKGQTLEVLKENPYILIEDIYDITFAKIDRLRSNFGITNENPNRVEAAIVYAMNEVNNTLGNTYLSWEEVIYYTKRVLKIDNEDYIISAIDSLLKKDRIIEFEENLTLQEMYEAETNIATRLTYLNKQDNKIKIKDEEIKDLEKFYNIEYNDDQKKAIKSAIENNVLIITGGPGTGKTTVIKGICSLYQNRYDLTNRELQNELSLLAPTGRASKRMSEQTNLPASTIHRFLKWNKEDNTFMINEENKSNCKIVIIDEVSMLDTYLFHNLLLGLDYNTKIILIGDHNQLPSVGPGQILKDLIDSDLIPVIKLEKLYRQKEESNINLLAYQINHDEEIIDIFNFQDDLKFIEATSANLKEKLQKCLKEYQNTDYNNFQIMAPIYRGDNGIDELNYYVQTIINPKKITKNEIIHNGVTYREMDKVLNITNMPDENIFNGDIGTILKITKQKNKEMIIDFDQNEVRLTPSNFSNLKLGYVISIHKSQGSEFDTVIIPILNEYRNMLYKKLIYTGITRAKKKLILIGETSAFYKAINNKKENDRQTNLKKLLNLCMFP